MKSDSKEIKALEVERNLKDFASTLNKLIAVSNRFAGRPAELRLIFLIANAHSTAVTEFARRTSALTDVIVSSYGETKSVKLSTKKKESK